jgi:4,5:9,10-diseco-3-hydroxy-5,9,17-trioxoandrosta-1(10),2-diene-4-oate hydrolase
MSPAQAQPAEKNVVVDGLSLRYLELGEGPVVLMLHGGSLGSSADVFLGNIPPLAAAGFRVIAYDQPGFGLSETPTDHSAGYRRNSILNFMDALGIRKAALIAHSQAGRPGVQLAFKAPERVTHVAVLGTGSLLPPAPDGAGKTDGVAQQRLERRMAQSEPTLEDTRKLLEANLFHTELITPEALALRHSRSIGKAFAAFQARAALPADGGEKAAESEEAPLWRRLAELPRPLLLVFGREDRAKAFERAMALKEAYPQLDLHIASGCKHLVPWDAADLVLELAAPFLKRAR